MASLPTPSHLHPLLSPPHTITHTHHTLTLASTPLTSSHHHTHTLHPHTCIHSSHLLTPPHTVTHTVTPSHPHTCTHSSHLLTPPHTVTHTPHRHVVYRGSAVSYRAVKLHPSTDYTFRIAACSESGQGEWSDHVTFSTTPTPPHPPTGLYAAIHEILDLSIPLSPPLPLLSPPPLRCHPTSNFK